MVLYDLYEFLGRKQDMILPIVLGAVCGVLGFLPLIAGLRLARKATPTSNIGHAGALLLGVFGSFVLLIGTLIVCIVGARDAVLPFALAEVVALSASAIAFGAYKLVRK